MENGLSTAIIFDGIESELTDAVLDRISKMDKHPDDTEINKIGYEEMYNILVAKVETPVYGDETVKVTIGLHKNDKGMYEISEEDMLTLDNALFAIE